ncbi:MAG: hypothetical protein Q9201_005590 [Fulgogasparrea decipioides]
MSSARDSCELRNADNAECWKRVKDETGYDNYLDYLLTHEKEGEMPHERLVSYLDKRPQMMIFAISSFDKGPDGQAEQILANIRNPPSQVLARVLLVENVSEGTLGLPRRWIDAIGLGLRTPPALFDAFLRKTSKTSQSQVLVRAGVGTIGRAFFTTARNYLPVNLNVDVVTFTTDLSQTRASASAMPKVNDTDYQDGLYELLLSGQLERYKGSSIDLKTVLVHALLPLLQSCLAHLRQACHEANTEYLRMSSVRWATGQADLGKPMEIIRYKLRRAMGSLEQSLSGYKTYLRRESIRKPEQYEAFSDITEDAEACLDDARGLEAEIRDWLQVYVGNRALQESKKSIELSNLQIEEAKRVKVGMTHSLLSL